jgi:hypothetical protein
MRDVKPSSDEWKMWKAVLAAAAGRVLPEWPADEESALSPRRERNDSPSVPLPAPFDR